MDQRVAREYAEEIGRARISLAGRDYLDCFVHLERAHILSQRSTIRHTYAHWLMFRAGLQQRDLKEIVGQVPRMLASILFSRIWVPRGNTGRARVSAMKPMPIPGDMRHLDL